MLLPSCTIFLLRFAPGDEGVGHVVSPDPGMQSHGIVHGYDSLQGRSTAAHAAEPPLLPLLRRAPTGNGSYFRAPGMVSSRLSAVLVSSRTRLLELEGTTDHSPPAAASIEGLGTSSSSRKLYFEENTQKLQPSKK
ncbi:hypothetical protein EJB05_25425, partial [Eragrostis curvula]